MMIFYSTIWIVTLIISTVKGAQLKIAYDQDTITLTCRFGNTIYEIARIDRMAIIFRSILAEISPKKNGGKPIIVDKSIRSRASVSGFADSTDAFGSYIEIEIRRQACKDSGDYSCVCTFAKPGHKSENTTATRDVIVPTKPDVLERPLMQVTPPLSVSVTEGTDLMFTCSGNVGGPPGWFWWFTVKDGFETNVTDRADNGEPQRSKIKCTFIRNSKMSLSATSKLNGATVQCKMYQPFFNPPEGGCAGVCTQSETIMVYGGPRISTEIPKRVFQDNTGMIVGICSTIVLVGLSSIGFWYYLKRVKANQYEDEENQLTHKRKRCHHHRHHHRHHRRKKPDFDDSYADYKTQESYDATKVTTYDEETGVEIDAEPVAETVADTKKESAYNKSASTYATSYGGTSYGGTSYGGTSYGATSNGATSNGGTNDGGTNDEGSVKNEKVYEPPPETVVTE